VLAKIREKTQGIIATLILAFVAIPFVLWGIGSYFGGSATAPVAEVNGVEIGQREFLQHLEEVQRANPANAGNKVLKQLVLERLIDQTLLTSQARDSGYRISDAQLAALIHQVPDFQRNGKFQPGLYEAALSGQGMRPTDFEAQVRQESIVNQVRQGLSESAFVTEAEVDAVLKLVRQERRVSYAIVSPDAFAPKVKISDADVDAYYKANQEAFLTPEAVRVDYVTLNAADIAKAIEPTDAQLHQAYEAEAASFTTPAKRRVSHILISLPSQAKPADVKAAKAQAEDLLKQIRAGADFATLAKKYSDDADSAKKGGDLGDVAPGILPPALEKAAAALKPGEVSEPVRTSFGFHLVKLTGFTPEKRKPFDAVKQQLRDLVRKRKGEDRFYELAENFKNLVYEHPDGLDTVAKTLDLKIQKSDWFTRDGGSGIAAKAPVVSAAFEPDVLNRQRNSDAIEADTDTLVALHVVDHRPAAVRPLAEVRTKIEQTLRERRAREQAQAATEKWVKAIEQGEAIGKLAAEPGVTLHSAQTLTREHPGSIKPEILNAAFAAPRPKDKPVVGQVDLGKTGFAVYVVEAVKDGDPASADAGLRNQVRELLRRHHGEDYYASYRAGLRKTADIEIHAEQL
jgi:peptidyl-prolyl cis-trans isomerase D